MAHWDIFCKVIDNFGDIGVSFRLAKELSLSYGIAVHLWVDDLESFTKMDERIVPELPCQTLGNIRVFRWQEPLPEFVLGDAVIEMFACRMPEVFVEKMAHAKKPPVWINLEYLTAEGWIEDCHLKNSPHPKYPLHTTFFFPGFTPKTGGLLKERALISWQNTFDQPDLKKRFLSDLIKEPVCHDALFVSLFCYQNKALETLLQSFSQFSRNIVCFCSPSPAQKQISDYFSRPFVTGDKIENGALSLYAIPFLLQENYDRLLLSCDLNFVRGEDSFVRAQWAARPMIWHIYPQEEKAHLAKLHAFLDRFSCDMPKEERKAYTHFSLAWNLETLSSNDFALWADFFSLHQKHAQSWKNQLLQNDELCAQLTQFVDSKL